MVNTIKNSTTFINFTGFEDKVAEDLVGRLRDIVVSAEQNRQADVKRAEEAIRIYKNDLWSEKDIEFFEEFDMTPYQIPEGRAPINKLVNTQRAAQYDFQFKPLDMSSYERHRKNRDKWVQEHVDEFATPKQARKYYDTYADDELAMAISIYHQNQRIKNKTKKVEAQCFENMLITGLDFMKTTYNDGIDTQRRGVRQMIYDRSSVDPELSDIEYIGEVNRLYKDDLVTMFPEHKQQILDRFEKYTTLRGNNQWNTAMQKNWRQFYKFDHQRSQSRLKVCELWFKSAEERWVVEQDGDARKVQYGLDKKQVQDKLKEIELDNLKDRADEGDQKAIELFQQRPNVIDKEVQNIVSNKYKLRTTQEFVWNKAVFSHNALFEFKRNPLPHGSHPYTPFFAQFVEGWYTGLIDDVKDLLIALNKAVMFRELMMAHGAKGLLVVDRKSVNRSQYSVDDIRQMWTQIGGIIDLDLAGNRKLSDVFQQVTTIGEGFAEISRVIQELEQKVYKIMGVNEAMLGFTSDGAAASQVRQRIKEGQGNNGVIFDNFNKALETHTHEKVFPLVVTEMIQKRPKAIRVLGDNRSEWLDLTYDNEFELFADAIQSGNYVVKLETQQIDEQLSQQQQSILLQSAMQDPNLSTEAALEFSGMPQIQNFLRRSREIMRQKKREQLADQVDLKKMQQMMLQQGLDADTVSDLISKAKLERLKEMEAEQNQSNQNVQGMSEVQRQANEGNRLQQIEKTTLDGGNDGNG